MNEKMKGESDVSTEIERSKTGGETQEDELLYITFELTGEKYGVPADFMDEIVKEVDIFNIPGSSREVIGATEIRDEVLPILDLKRCLDLGTTEDGWEEVLLIDLDEESFALPVDKLDDIISPGEDQMIQPSAITNLDDNKLKLIINLSENESVRVLDIEKLISENLEDIHIESKVEE